MKKPAPSGGKIRRLVLDVMKPHEPSIISLAQQLGNAKGISGVDITVVGVDRRVESARITLEGDNINYEKIKKIVEDNGGTIKSMDKVSAGIKMVHQSHSLPHD